ncbi:MAG: response regulator, partial [Chloroflexota bacterium]
RTGLGESGRTYLVDADGRLIQGATVAGQGGAVDSDGIRQVRAGQTGQGLYVDDRGVPVIGVYRWIADRGAGLLAEVSQDEAFASARQLALVIGLVGLASAVLLAGGIWFVARRVTGPILQLAATAAKVTAGDLEAVSGIHSEDEVGTLAVAFDEMTSELRANVATLERRVQDRTAELDRQKSYFESLVEVSPVAIVTMDRDERVSGWNPAATALFGFEPDEAIGRNIDDLVLADGAPRDGGHDLTLKAARQGRAHEIGQRKRKDGSVIDAEVLIVPLVVHGEQLGYYAIYHDITELNAARRDADSANQAKSAFLAAMSHEIRTPMNAVIGMSGLLLDTSLDTDQRDYTETIHTSGEALLTIINDILDFSKIEAGRFELDVHPFALAATIEGALDVMGPIAANKGLELAYSLDPDFPEIFIGDAGRLRQIVLNLLSNAIKFTETGEITVGVTASGPAAGDEHGRWAISLEIHDTGIGIPPDRVGRLFQSFSQADASISRKYGGTGLGLAISRRLAELMDGSLVADSTGVPGEGSTFRLVVQLPAAADQTVRAAKPPVDIHGRRVLLVDDNATNLRILVTQLERLGLVVTATRSPIEARDLATAGGAAYDVVVTDLRMPELDGMALAAAIRGSRADGAPPVIVLSSLGQRERDADAVAAFLTKPVKPAALRETLAQVLSGSVVQQAQRAPDRWTIDPTMGERHPLRLLLAEDNAVNQKLATRLLERMGYTTDIAGDGLQAIAALETNDYDVVLMDVQMPELDGLEATRRIRARWPDRPLRIIAMTANAMEGDRDACLAAGMDDYVSKPIHPDELAAALVAVEAVP